MLSLGYLPDAFVEHFPDGTFGDVKLRYAVEDEPLGTAGGIRFAADRRASTSASSSATATSSPTSTSTALVAFHDARGAEATIASRRRSTTRRRSASCPTYADGEVKAFVEKPPKGAAPTNWINAGTYVLEPSVLDRVPPA